MVIIKDLEMPQNCVKCNETGLQALLGCQLIFNGCANCGRHPNCPLIKVDVQPIVHAKWMWDKNRFMYVCSNCKGNPTEGTGYSHDYPALVSHYRYCKDCGAKMDKE